MKTKLLLTAAALVMLTGASAFANEFNLNVNLGGGGDVVAPSYAVPVPAVIVNPYVPQGYDPRHRAHDWRYWQNRHAHDHRDSRDHHDAHWDHDHR